MIVGVYMLDGCSLGGIILIARFTGLWMRISSSAFLLLPTAHMQVQTYSLDSLVSRAPCCVLIPSFSLVPESGVTIDLRGTPVFCRFGI